MSPLQTPSPVNKGGVWALKVTKTLRATENEVDDRTLNEKQYGHLMALPVLYTVKKHFSPGDWAFVKEAIYPSAGVTIPSGMWICVQMVPSDEHSGAASGPEYKRSTSKNYYPRWPLPTDEKDIFWYPFNAFLPMDICVDNKPNSYLVAATPLSGSAS